MLCATKNRAIAVSAAFSKDGGVLFDIERDRMLKLNPVAAEMWQHLRTGASQSQVVEMIAERYQVDKPRVAADLDALLQRLDLLGLQLTAANVAEQELAPADAGPGRSQLAPEPKDDAKPAPWMVVRSLLGLLMCDIALVASSAKAICQRVEAWPLSRSTKHKATNICQVCNAVACACVWYPAKTACLQRSAVTTCLLRDCGVSARLIIGARQIPFLAHAWVEVEGSVVNDSPSVKQFYQQLSSF